MDEHQEMAYRRLEPQWNLYMVTASIAISLLGAFTSTQLWCHARMSLHFSSVLIWTVLSSSVFGFCSIWCLHEVAMLACELDLRVGIDPPLTILSAILATFFTFVALASDLLWDRYRRQKRRKLRKLKKRRNLSPPPKFFDDTEAETDHFATPLLRVSDEESQDADEDAERLEISNGYAQVDGNAHKPDHRAHLSAADDLFRVDTTEERRSSPHKAIRGRSGNRSADTSPMRQLNGSHGADRGESVGNISEDEDSGSLERTESLRTGDSGSEYSASRRSSSLFGSTAGSSTFGGMMNMAYHRGTSRTKNLFVSTGEALYEGFTIRNVMKGFLWSLAITSMHYVGIAGLRVPHGFYTLKLPLVILSAFISWVVCLVGCILMPQMETHLAQQCFFSVVATMGVAAMHFTGMAAVSFWSDAPPSNLRGYPPELAIAVVAIAIITCIGANGLLAHSATVSRNKLAEIVWTRRELWRTIAQKENAEAAASARSDFIASASHEIRTPLHHLQGYSDLLARTELTEEGRILLLAIQRATKTLSLITNNVLDWSKLERDADTVCRPVALNMRTVCESIIVLLPNKDDEAEVDLLVVVTPDIPTSLFLDETYLHRILMNLLSNALKFTRSGYILLMLEMQNGKLVATVKDTGCGIPASFIPHMFEPFKQAQTRGSQRGTGLGLSIIKHLLHKMDGTIDVQSAYQEPGMTETISTGSTFTVTIPIQPSTATTIDSVPSKVFPKIAIFHDGNPRQLEGLKIAWEKFGYDVDICKQVSDISNNTYKYVWTDLSFLIRSPEHIQALLHLDESQVLIPYDTQENLKDLSELTSAPHVYVLQKPLVWHAFEQRIAAQDRIVHKAPRVVRFASQVELLDEGQKEKLHTVVPEEPHASEKFVILLVEDNPINQKLGQKMLRSLGYEVLTAADGEDAIEQMVKNDLLIDAVLMDQSMPRRDGITATREIRAMEASGTITRKRPIIALTAVVNSEAQAQFKAAGADDFLAKPLSLSKLEQTLAAHLNLSKR